MNKLFTIGYSGYDIGTFTSALLDNGASLLVDVRSEPHSAYFRQFDQEPLEQDLNRHHIFYRHFAKAFGGRQTDRRYFTSEGYLDFELFAQAKVFQDGVRKLTAVLNSGYSAALMCAEKDPINCHRAILIARAFHEDGVAVEHICPGRENETHGQLEERLLRLFKLDSRQRSFFDADDSSAEQLKLAYRLKNAKMGRAFWSEQIT